MIAKRAGSRPGFLVKRKYSGGGEHAATLEVLDGDRARIIGSLHFTTVTALLPLGIEAIKGGRAAVIDLAAVTASDSSGLALLVEWLSVAKGARPHCATKISPPNCSSSPA